MVSLNGIMSAAKPGEGVSMETTYHLKIQGGPEDGQEFALDKPELFLGRDPSNDISLSDPEVSRRHARFVLEGSQYSIEDLGSTNGTFLRGNPVHGLTPLQPGDLIAIGERVVLIYETRVFDPDATVAMPRRAGEEIATEEGESGTKEPVRPAAPLPQAAVSIKQQKPHAEATPGAEEAKREMPAVLETTGDSYHPTEPEFAGKMPAQPKAPRKRSAWRSILLIIVLLLLIFCVIPWIIIDVTNSYCLFLPGILNTIQPGVCP
jgi:pSer/pThr/pTyr-binding forkhead associated (FHA) protein